MKFQIADIALILSIACLSSAAAFSPSSLAPRQSAGASLTNRISKTTTSSNTKLFSQWDEEEETSVKRSSFEEAAKAATDEDAAKELEEMGDFDATSTVSC